MNLLNVCLDHKIRQIIRMQSWVTQPMKNLPTVSCVTIVALFLHLVFIILLQDKEHVVNIS